MHRIVILGTGTSGLAAALRLATSARRSEVEITLIEAKHQPGGRTRSYLDAETGDTLDNGQHLLMGCYSATQDYMKLIGASELVSHSRGLSIPFALFNEYSGTTRIAHFKTKNYLPAPLHALAGLRATDLLTAEEKFAAMRFSAKVSKLLSSPETAKLTCTELFQKLRQPSGLIRKLWEPLTLATLNARCDEASVLPLLSVLKLALLGKRSGATFLYPKVGLSELLISPAVEKLKSLGVKFEFRRPISKIREIPFGDSSRGYNVESGDWNLDAETVIVASPLEGIELPSALSADATNPAPRYSPIVNAYFWLDTPMLNQPIQAFVGTTLQWAFSKQTKLGGERLALTVSAGDELAERANEEIESILWGELQRTIGANARNHSKLIRSQIIRERSATPLFTPEAQIRRPTVKTSLSNFFLAGDLVQNLLPATIEGAIRNGFSAADVFLETFSQNGKSNSAITA